MSLTLFNLMSVGLMSLCLAASVLSSNMLILWILIEMSGFCLMYMFLSCDSKSKVSLSSFLFYLTNGMSSMLMVSGAFLESPILLEFGLCSKFFIFPFSMMLFYVFKNISWGVMFMVGSMFKVFILGLSSMVKVLINWELLMGTIITCMFFMGFVTLNIKGLWFMLNLSSSVVLFVGCVVLNKEDMFGLLLMYLVLSMMKVYLLSSLDLTNNTYVSVNNSATLSYLMFLVGFPVSLKMVYKILSAVAMLSMSSSTLLLVWMMYIIIETGFLFLYFSNILSNLKSLYYLVEFSGMCALQAQGFIYLNAKTS